MIKTTLPTPDQMYDALVRRDASFDGIFFAAVRTTRIFCRPVCTAKKPERRNVEFFETTGEALSAGYRPCKRCEPMEETGSAPAWLKPLLAEVENGNGRRWTDSDLRSLGVDPARVRRWFKQHHGMTFHAFRRAHRVGRALSTLQEGATITEAAYDNGYESLSAFYAAFRELLDTTPARAHSAAPLFFTRITTPLGPMLAAATDDALCLLEFADRPVLDSQLERMARELGCAPMPTTNPILRQTERELREYFSGDRHAFDVPLRMVGTEFQRQAWDALTCVPYGETRSYGQQSRAIGKAEAVRAVGRANGDNPIAVIVPCHRVVGANGKLTGYGGGLWRKKWLLDHELRHRPLLTTPALVRFPVS